MITAIKKDENGATLFFNEEGWLMEPDVKKIITHFEYLGAQ
jgi:hypothetical protein